MKTGESPVPRRRLRRNALLYVIWLGFMGIGLFLLVTEHRAHAFGWLPHLLLGACLMLLHASTRLDKRTEMDNEKEHQ